jgi:hypothetical protein
MGLSRRVFLKYCVGSAAALGLQFSPLGSLEKVLAGGGPLKNGPLMGNVPTYPIATDVFTTLDKTIIALPPWPVTLLPCQVSLYAPNHYGEWDKDAAGFPDGPPCPYLCPNLQTGALNPTVNDPAATTLLSSP